MKRIHRIIALILALSMCLSIAALAEDEAERAEEDRSSIFILARVADIGALGSGVMRIDHSVSSYYSIDELGVYQVKLYTSAGRLMKIYYSDAYPAMMGYNCSTHDGYLTYPGTVGTSYYAVVSFFAQDGSVSETKSSVTRTAVCR